MIANPDIDLSDCPEHVVRATEKLNLRKHAITRAEAGATWLDDHAPAEWRLRLIRIHSGWVSSRVNFHYNKDYPLSLAFVADKRFDRLAGEQRWPEVAKHFGFHSPIYEDPIFLKHGFYEQAHVSGDTIVKKEIDIRFLNYAWNVVLGDFWTIGMVGQPKLSSAA